jgi:hypothetical protein
MLKLTFNEQGSRVIITLVQVGAVKIYGAVAEALGKKERQDETQFTTKIGGNTSLGSNFFGFVKFSFLVKGFMPYYVETGRSHPLITGLHG